MARFARPWLNRRQQEREAQVMSWRVAADECRRGNFKAVAGLDDIGLTDMQLVRVVPCELEYWRWCAAGPASLLTWAVFHIAKEVTRLECQVETREPSKIIAPLYTDAFQFFSQLRATLYYNGETSLEMTSEFFDPSPLYYYCREVIPYAEVRRRGWKDQLKFMKRADRVVVSHHGTAQVVEKNAILLEPPE